MTLPEHEEQPVVVRDTFPAHVTTTAGTYATARAVVTRERLYVYRTENGRPALVLDEPYDPAGSTIPRYNAPRQQPAHLLLADGRTVTVTRQRGCGCGSPLKAWKPWSPYRVAA